MVSWLFSVLVGHVCHGADTRLCVVSNQGLIVETKRALATATAAAAKVGLEGTVVTIVPGKAHEQLVGWGTRLGGIDIELLGEVIGEDGDEAATAEEAASAAAATAS